MPSTITPIATTDLALLAFIFVSLSGLSATRAVRRSCTLEGTSLSRHFGVKGESQAGLGSPDRRNTRREEARRRLVTKQVPYCLRGLFDLAPARGLTGSSRRRRRRIGIR